MNRRIFKNFGILGTGCFLDEELTPGGPGNNSQGNLIFIRTLSDLPTPVGGEITLEAYKTYFFVPDDPAAKLDLQGNRFKASGPVTLLGGSSETCYITSTGIDPADFLFSSEYTAAIQNLTFADVPKAIEIDGTTFGGVALDWTGVNFLNVPTVGNITECDNFVFTKGAFLNSKGISFFGTIQTIAFNNSLFAHDGQPGDIITIDATATITRRFRVIYSSVALKSGVNGINVDPAATIPNQAFILDTVNFSGTGVYLPGVNSTSNKALFVNCTGISNSAEISQYYMVGNATATVIGAPGVAEKVLGTTTSAAVTQKFTNTDNRATYNGAIKRFFSVTVTASLTSGNNNQIGFYIAKNGSLLTESETYITTNGAGRAESVTCQTLVELENGNFIEVYAENATAANNITVTELSVVII